MFTLQDGREHLYQWDLDRYILVNDSKISEVHFCNRTTDCSLVVEVKDGLAAIPNIILQDARPIRAYAYVDDKYTLVEQQFTVKSRTRPADYIYTETEVKRWEDLAAKAENTLADAEAAIASIESVAAEGIRSVETKANEAITTIETVSAEAKESVETTYTEAVNTLNGIVDEANQAMDTVNQAVTKLDNKVDGLATEEYVTDAIAGIDISNLATKTELDTKLNRCTTSSSVFSYVTVSNRVNPGSFIPVENMNYDATSSGNAIARRDNNAQIRVPVTPTQNYHAASKAYVDSAITNALGVIENGTY